MTFAILVGKLSHQPTLVESKLKKSTTNIENQTRHIPRNVHRPHPPLHTRDSHRRPRHRNPVLHLSRPLNLRTRNDSLQSLHRYIH